MNLVVITRRPSSSGSCVCTCVCVIECVGLGIMRNTHARITRRGDVHAIHRTTTRSLSHTRCPPKFAIPSTLYIYARVD